jgi:hypothetical protein
MVNRHVLAITEAAKTHRDFMHVTFRHVIVVFSLYVIWTALKRH